jgi:hypothetical protein
MEQMKQQEYMYDLNHFCVELSSCKYTTHLYAYCRNDQNDFINTTKKTIKTGYM